MRVRKAPLESNVQKQILDYLESVGAFCYKTISSNKRGIPDITAVYKGVPVFIEVKRDMTKTASVLQQYQMDKIVKAGGIAKVCFCVDQAKEIVYNIDNEKGDKKW